MDGVLLFLFGCGVTRLHCCWNVSSGDLRIIQKVSVPFMRDILIAPDGFLDPSILRALCNFLLIDTGASGLLLTMMYIILMFTWYSFDCRFVKAAIYLF